LDDSQAEPESVSQSHSDFINTMQRLRVGSEGPAQRMEVEADASASSGIAAQASTGETTPVSDSVILCFISVR
jgi:hypothetical protein